METNFNALVQKYRSMTPEDKIQAVREAIHFEAAPLHVLFAIVMIVEPENVEVILRRLENHR